MSKTKLPAKINDVVKLHKLVDMTKAEAIASNYAPFMGQVNDQIKALKKLDPENHEDAEKAKRIRIDCGKICARSTDQKKIDKELLTIETKLIDGLHNVVVGSARLTQVAAEDIEKHFETIEKKRIEELDETRRLMLGEYDTIMPIGSLGIMSNEVWDTFLLGNKTQFEAKEREMIEQEEREEAERVEAERVEECQVARTNDLSDSDLWKFFNYDNLILGEMSEENYQDVRGEAEKKRNLHIIEQERIAKENERLKKEAAERERLAKIEADKRAKAESDRLAKEKKERAIHEENERKEREKQEVKFKVERDARRLLEKQIQDKKDAELKAEAKRLAKIEIDLKKGDTMKVRDLVIGLEDLKKYEFKSKRNQKMYEGVCEMIDKMVVYIGNK